MVKALVAHPAVTASKGCQDSGCSRVHVSGLPTTAGMLSLWRVDLGAVDAYTEACWMSAEPTWKASQIPLEFWERLPVLWKFLSPVLWEL